MMDMILLVVATGCDSFLMSIAYGVEGIRIPFKACVLIAFCGTFCLGISFLLASVLTNVLSVETGKYISFTILFILGITNLFQVQVKHYVKKHKAQPLIIRFKEISFVIDIFLDETQADADQSKELSLKEAMYLGIALSIDSLASGLAFGIGLRDVRIVLLLSFIAGICIICIGSFLGKHISSFVNFDISWISGCMLLVLAFLRFY